MYLGIKRRFEEMAISCVCSEVVKNGEVLTLKGLAPAALTTVNGIALDGETYELVGNIDSEHEVYVIAALGAHRYSNEQNYDFGDFDDVVAGKTFRGYVLRRDMEYAIEEGVVDGEVAVGDFLCIKPSTHKWTKVTASEKGVLGKVIEKTTFEGRKMVTVLITR